jgi:integrase/recombinase XerD
MEVDRIADDYIAWLSSIWTPKTVMVRGTFARRRLREWGIAGFTTENIQGLVGPQAGHKGWTRATYYAHLKDLCAWLVAVGYLDADPMEGVVKPKRPNAVPRSFTDAEVARIMVRAEGRVREWIQLALLQGLRAHEIAKQRGEDVTADYLYVDGKGGVLAALPTHPEIWAMAQRHDEDGYWYPGSDDGHITQNIVSIEVGKFFREVGISKGSIHRCRHTYATRLLRQGANIRTVQKLMRHASLASTQVYTDVSDDELRDAIGRLTA